MPTSTANANGGADAGEAARSWIRGVNIGGWLLAERFVVPYFFAVNSCHLQGSLCRYPGQIDAPIEHELCDLTKCTPHLIESATGEKDYPTDEYTLASSFDSKKIARKYFERHWDTFVTQEDVQKIKQAGVTHVRVPLPHWILGSIEEGEPWVEGGWPYFTRFVVWCREAGIQVWPDIHTAPGSQNGFDNSGQLLPGDPTCAGWSEWPDNVGRSLTIVQDVIKVIHEEALGDVITGIGILNEPFIDCDPNVVREFNRLAFDSVRETLGDDTSIYIGDMFNATKWNDGYWIDDTKYTNTYLDSHYYHVFAQEPRALSPKQHIAYVCGRNSRDTTACCYEDYPYNTQASAGISRIVSEWSASFDTLVVAKLGDVMKGIATDGKAPELDREIPQSRKDFLLNFVQAQMVTYEAKSSGVSSGWFYWTLKTEGGAFAEWDFLRGLDEGWIPSVPDPLINSEDLYGTCHEIAERTVDDMGFVEVFPDPSTLPDHNWQGVDIDDDYVVSHADSLIDTDISTPSSFAQLGSAQDNDVSYSGFRTFDSSLTLPTDPSQTTEPATEASAEAVATNAEVSNAAGGDGDAGATNNAPPPNSSSSFVPASGGNTNGQNSNNHNHKSHGRGGTNFIPFIFVAFLGYGIYRVFFGRSSRQYQYTQLDTSSTLTV